MADKLTYTIDEVAQALCLSRNSVYKAVHKGDIPSLRIGQRFIIPRAAINKLLGEEQDLTPVKHDTHNAPIVESKTGKPKQDLTGTPPKISEQEWIQAVTTVAKVIARIYVADHPEIFNQDSNYNDGKNSPKD